jgi:hypothetical protein
MTGTKPLISLTESVPPRLTPFETATSPNVPAVLPPIEIFSVAVELWVKLPWIESVAGFADESPAVTVVFEVTAAVIVPLPTSKPFCNVNPVEAVKAPSTVVVPLVCV